MGIAKRVKFATDDVLNHPFVIVIATLKEGSGFASPLFIKNADALSNDAKIKGHL